MVFEPWNGNAFDVGSKISSHDLKRPRVHYEELRNDPRDFYKCFFARVDDLDLVIWPSVAKV